MYGSAVMAAGFAASLHCAPAIASPVPLAQILRVDALGYECIRQDELEIAFAATGKGVRLPRTCLPAPCDVLTRGELGDFVIGRPTSDSEWDEYYARYAEHCRAEVTPFDEEAPAPGEFWSGLVPPADVAGTLVAAVLPGATPRGVAGPSPVLTGGQSIVGRHDDGDPADPIAHWGFVEPERPGGDPNGPPPIPPAIPLPAALWLLLTAVAVPVATRGLSRPFSGGVDQAVP
ncbi:hypothetical protein LX81_00773 [Palleronia aestuarii]|uniref:Secreted protein n=1 Tax=Palleronia aestuarii TaxID=568105 RepID=A0A2W7NR23_9RHOB|nr:hypothetical protein [Palleronia aestuarii]PZX19074.1 hypothetical protein LX81_00773 [Palleronia aestuarii]